MGLHFLVGHHLASYHLVQCDVLLFGKEVKDSFTFGCFLLLEGRPINVPVGGGRGNSRVLHHMSCPPGSCLTYIQGSDLPVHMFPKPT